jgi:hypothetical protein
MKTLKIGMLTHGALLLCALLFPSRQVAARDLVRIDKNYEDSVRVVILWNESDKFFKDKIRGNVPVGPQTRDFVLNALSLDTSLESGNVFVSPTPVTTWAMIKQRWPGKLPHVIVHINAGYRSNSGSKLKSILDSAVQNRIGVVSIGDDAAASAEQTFGVKGTDNDPPPFDEKDQLDSLWVGLNRNNDNRLKDANVFPYINGIISNAIDSMGAGEILFFKPYCNNNADSCRLQNDADKYLPITPQWLTFLGYMRGHENGAFVGDVDSLNIIVAIQDTLNETQTASKNAMVRRGVMLGYQPQYLRQKDASQQIVYDAIMWASLAHQLGLTVGEFRLRGEPAFDTITTDDSIKFFGEIEWDSTDIWGKVTKIRRPSLDSTITWQLTPSTGALLSSGAGPSPSNVFSATRAFETYTITGHFVDPQSGEPHTAIMQVYVKAGAPAQLTVESSPLKQTSPHAPNPVGRLQIASNEQSKSAYAVLRDRYGNWAGPATQTVWTPAQPILTTSVLVADSGKGQVTKNLNVSDDSTLVLVTDTRYSLTDSVMVRIAPYTYDSIQIYSGTPPTGTLISGVFEFNTNEQRTLYAMGWRSDGGGSEQIAVEWRNLLTPVSTVNSPGESQSWLLSPILPATGKIVAVRGTLSDTIDVKILPGPPTSLDIRLLTPPELRIAGKPIAAEIVLRNDDTLYFNDTCFAATIVDSLADARNRLVFPDSTVPFGRASLCFLGGRDTISLLLYNAPYNRTPHQIGVTLDYGLSDTSEKFILLPDTIVRLVIEYAEGREIDTLRLTAPEGVEALYSRGYDAYDNRFRPDPQSDWSSNGSLHDPATVGSSRLFYEAKGVVVSESGQIIARLSGNGAIRDSAYVIIKGPGIRMMQSLTRDTSGNGYLDRIDIYFAEVVDAQSVGLITKIAFSGRGVNFTNVSLVGRNGTMQDSVFYLAIAENKTLQPQTDWELSIAMQGVAGLKDLTDDARTVDGAGPVIWSVEKDLKGDINSNRDDMITVVFSEAVISTSMSKLDPSLKPGSFLRVWDLDASGIYRLVPGVFDSIDGLSEVVYDAPGYPGTIIRFTMENNQELLQRYRVNIDSAAGVLVDDAIKLNAPNQNNQRVRVQSKRNPSDIVSVPNPSRPIGTRIMPGELLPGHQPGAREWIITDRAGTVLSFSIPMDEQRTGKVRLYIKIYDGVGNLVISATQLDLVNQIRGSLPAGADVGDAFSVDMYWNGYNQSGMAVAPGSYRVFVLIDFESPSVEDVRKSTNIGMAF